MIRRTEVPIYGRRLVLCDDREEADRALGDLPSTHGAEAWVGARDGSRDVVMYVGDPRPELIAHEAVHAANEILGLAGVEIDAKNDEALAYLVEWVVGRWHKLMVQT